MTARWNFCDTIPGADLKYNVEEVRKMVDRFELVHDVVMPMADVIEAIRRHLIALRQRRAKLKEVDEVWAVEFVEFLDVLIADQEAVGTDLQRDLEVLQSGLVPPAYEWWRRGRTNLQGVED